MRYREYCFKTIICRYFDSMCLARETIIEHYLYCMVLKKNKKYHDHSIEGHQTDRGLKCLVITVSRESCFEAAGFLEGRDLLSNEKAWTVVGFDELQLLLPTSLLLPPSSILAFKWLKGLASNSLRVKCATTLGIFHVNFIGSFLCFSTLYPIIKMNCQKVII